MKKFNTFFIMLFALILLLISSCSKDEPCLTGTIRFTNISSNPYNVYINGSYETRISGKTSQELTLFEGRQSVRVEQVSGFLLFPTVVNENLSVFGCQETSWVFP